MSHSSLSRAMRTNWQGQVGFFSFILTKLHISLALQPDQVPVHKSNDLGQPQIGLEQYQAENVWY